jgi:photosystem II biogenesis protein Psp29
VNTVRTVSDTKRDFYTFHTRPINSIYRRVVEELMVEMHLLSVNTDFKYDPIYALGVVTTYNRFMEGYRPEGDRTNIFTAMCKALQADPQKLINDAEQLQASINGMPVTEFLEKVKLGTGGAGLWETLIAIANNPKFKYSRLFAIGLYTLVETMDKSWVTDEVRLNDVIQTLAQRLNLSKDKAEKDLELYRSNLDKMTQARQVMEDILKADRKKKEERQQAKQGTATTDSESAIPPGA